MLYYYVLIDQRAVYLDFEQTLFEVTLYGSANSYPKYIYNMCSRVDEILLIRINTYTTVYFT